VGVLWSDGTAVLTAFVEGYRLIASVLLLLPVFLSLVAAAVGAGCLWSEQASHQLHAGAAQAPQGWC
jgi:hypothetical protein